MNKVGIVLPTVQGRENVFDRVLAAFQSTCPDDTEFEITVPEGFRTVGEAWNAGVLDLEDPDYIFFAIDDSEPHEGWCEVAMRTADAGFIPAPRLQLPDGSLEMCGSMGFGALLPEAPDCTPCRNTGIIFIRAEWWEEIGEFLPIHYSCDDDFCWRAMLIGHRIIYRSEMRFTHHHEHSSTLHVRQAAQQHIAMSLEHATTLRYADKAASALTPVAAHGE